MQLNLNKTFLKQIIDALTLKITQMMFSKIILEACILKWKKRKQAI
jgi:hypothetical protein